MKILQEQLKEAMETHKKEKRLRDLWLLIAVTSRSNDMSFGFTDFLNKVISVFGINVFGLYVIQREVSFLPSSRHNVMDHLRRMKSQ